MIRLYKHMDDRYVVLAKQATAESKGVIIYSEGEPQEITLAAQDRLLQAVTFIVSYTEDELPKIIDFNRNRAAVFEKTAGYLRDNTPIEVKLYLDRHKNYSDDELNDLVRDALVQAGWVYDGRK